MHRIDHILIPTLCGIFFIFLTGCKSRTYDVTYSVKSLYAEKIQEVTISIGNHHSYTPGVLIPDSVKTYLGNATLDSPEKSSLSWTTAEGKKLSTDFSVTVEELRDKRGIVFKINPDNSITKEWRAP